jgi:hypothetical protein
VAYSDLYKWSSEGPSAVPFRTSVRVGPCLPQADIPRIVTVSTSKDRLLARSISSAMFSNANLHVSE